VGAIPETFLVVSPDRFLLPQFGRIKTSPERRELARIEAAGKFALDANHEFLDLAIDLAAGRYEPAARHGADASALCGYAIGEVVSVLVPHGVACAVPRDETDDDIGLHRSLTRCLRVLIMFL